MVLGKAGQPMAICNHEEADTRIVIHLCHALLSSNKALVCTVDTHVVAILLWKMTDFQVVNSEAEVWVTFGMGRNFRFLCINAIFASLGVLKSQCLPLFHALTGCDTTSGFYGKAKRSAWEAWNLISNSVTPTLESLATHPFQEVTETSIHFPNVQHFISVLYDKTSPRTNLNHDSMDIFCRHAGAIDHLPPTKVPSQLDKSFYYG